MKQLLLIFSFCIVAVLAGAQDLLPKPNPPRLVNDAANILSREQVAILEQRLVALDDSTTNQIAIVIIPTLNGYDVADYANKLLRAWGIGGSKHNNGVLILVAMAEKKFRIEVGYGLEGAIPDITAKSIIDNDLYPNFVNGDYYRGFDEAITSLGKAAKGEYNEKRNKNSGNEGVPWGGILLIIFVIVFVLARGGGGRGGGMMSRRGYSNLLLPLLFSGGGGRGGGFGGGGGGGFGGFGGGGGGGGGASGGW